MYVYIYIYIYIYYMFHNNLNNKYIIVLILE